MTPFKVRDQAAGGGVNAFGALAVVFSRTGQNLLSAQREALNPANMGSTVSLARRPWRGSRRPRHQIQKTGWQRTPQGTAWRLRTGLPGAVCDAVGHGAVLPVPLQYTMANLFLSNASFQRVGAHAAVAA